MQNHAVKIALLKALQGKPVSSIIKPPVNTVLTAKPTPHHVMREKEASQRDRVEANIRLAKFAHEMAQASVHGHKGKAQSETLLERVNQYIVTGIHKSSRALPKW